MMLEKGIVRMMYLGSGFRRYYIDSDSLNLPLSVLHVAPKQRQQVCQQEKPNLC